MSYLSLPCPVIVILQCLGRLFPISHKNKNRGVDRTPKPNMGLPLQWMEVLDWFTSGPHSHLVVEAKAGQPAFKILGKFLGKDFYA